MEFDNKRHYSSLQRKYAEVGDRTWKNADLIKESVVASRGYFDAASLLQRSPKPKELEVYALLSGLPFSKKTLDRLLAVQERMGDILGDTLHYWVKPLNFGVEYCVFKWPDDVWDEDWQPLIKNELSLMDKHSFTFEMHGAQINPDGCIVVKGYDEGGGIFKIRRHLKENLKFLPEKQSQWAHIPIGRVLEPMGEEKFFRLSGLISELNDSLIIEEVIRSFKFVHESRWYMEERSVLSEYLLD